ncbi:MAG: hypothetical protein AAF363_06565 [Bacteroidota bacterium]
MNYIKRSNLYFDKPYVKIAWNKQDELLVSYWMGFFTKEEIVAAGNRTIQVARIENAHKILYDASEMEILDPASQKFISGEFTRQMIEAGIEYSAAVVPDDVLAKSSVNQIKELMGQPIKSRSKYFDSFDQAYKWLKKI